MTTVADQKKDIRSAEKNIDKLEERIPMADTPMIPPAAQAVAASRSTKGAPLFVGADLDLVAKTGVQMDSWFFVSHLTSGTDRLDPRIHSISLTPPPANHMLQSIAS